MQPQTMEMVATSLAHVFGAVVLEHKMGDVPMPEHLAEAMVNTIAPYLKLNDKEKEQLAIKIYVESSSFLKEVEADLLRRLDE